MSMEFDNPTTYYAIEVPGKGYFTGNPFPNLAEDSAQYSHDSVEVALKQLDECRAMYTKLGVSEVGATARIVEFDVTLIRSLTRPLSPGSPSGTTE